jgi:hypothetical protein
VKDESHKEFVCLSFFGAKSKNGHHIHKKAIGKKASKSRSADLPTFDVINRVHVKDKPTKNRRNLSRGEAKNFD